MAQLDVTKTYDDGTVLTEAQLDASFDSIETFMNSTKISSDNIQTGGVTADCLATGSVTETKLGTGAVTVTKINDAEITLAKLASSLVAYLVPSGSQLAYSGTTAPTGWVLASGNTIGDGSSGGTERANADTSTLFSLLWSAYGNTELPIEDSSGVASTRGANAAADFAAHKRMPLPDLRGRVPVGKDNMGGTTASRITNAGAGIVGTTMGASGGAQTHTMTSAEMPSHTHTIDGGGNAIGSLAVTPYAMGADTSVGAVANVVNNTGGGGAHNNTQPSLISTYIIKL